MSLCGECRAPGSRTLSTCSIDCKTFYCVKCIWAATQGFPVSQIPTNSLVTKWYDVNWDGVFARRLVKKRIGEHWERIRNADLKYPIHVAMTEHGYDILDGCHRLVKLAIHGQDIAKVVIVDAETLKKCEFTMN